MNISLRLEYITPSPAYTVYPGLYTMWSAYLLNARWRTRNKWICNYNDNCQYNLRFSVKLQKYNCVGGVWMNVDRLHRSKLWVYFIEAIKKPNTSQYKITHVKCMYKYTPIHFCTLAHTFYTHINAYSHTRPWTLTLTLQWPNIWMHLDFHTNGVHKLHYGDAFETVSAVL